MCQESRCERKRTRARESGRGTKGGKGGVGEAEEDGETREKGGGEEGKMSTPPVQHASVLERLRGPLRRARALAWLQVGTAMYAKREGECGVYESGGARV